LRSTNACWLLSLLAISACARVSPPVGPTDLRGSCFRFDGAYFAAVTGNGSVGVRHAATATIRLDADSAPRSSLIGPVTMLAVTPIPFPVDSFTSRQWRSASGWRRTGDSVHIKWFSGLYGPMFDLVVRGDSLIGTVVHTSDVIVDGRRADKGPFAARALRVRCPGR
jgi:hypothetical protein